MAKEKTVYVCTNCGQDSPKWVGKCPSCGAWNTYVEEVVRKEPANKRPVSGLEPVKSKPVTLNGDKYKIMRQRNWKCNIRPLEEELGYQPQYPLERGVKETMDWYKKEGWL